MAKTRNTSGTSSQAAEVEFYWDNAVKTWVVFVYDGSGRKIFDSDKDWWSFDVDKYGQGDKAKLISDMKYKWPGAEIVGH